MIGQSYVNILDENDRTLTLLLGIAKPILKNFKYNNIQLVVGSEFDFYPKDLDFLVDIIESKQIKLLNIVGISKTCTAAVVYASLIAQKKATLPIRIFSFAPYTSLEESFYISRGLRGKVPRSLLILWDKKISKEQYNLRDQRILGAYDNIYTYVMYPFLGQHCEPECVEYIDDMENLTLVPFGVIAHVVLFPFWSKLKWDLKVEMFEGEYSGIAVEDYWYFLNFQKTFPLQESLYRLIFDTEHFLEEFRGFDRQMKSRAIPLSLKVSLTCLNRLLKVKAFYLRNIRKIKKKIGLNSQE